MERWTEFIAKPSPFAYSNARRHHDLGRGPGAFPDLMRLLEEDWFPLRGYRARGRLQHLNHLQCGRAAGNWPHAIVDAIDEVLDLGLQRLFRGNMRSPHVPGPISNTEFIG